MKEQLKVIDAKLEDHIKNDPPLHTVISGKVMTAIVFILGVIGLALVNRWTAPIIDKLSPPQQVSNATTQTNGNSIYHEAQWGFPREEHKTNYDSEPRQAQP
jgi:hypothetical protein